MLFDLGRNPDAKEGPIIADLGNLGAKFNGLLTSAEDSNGKSNDNNKEEGKGGKEGKGSSSGEGSNNGKGGSMAADARGRRSSEESN